MIVVNFSHPLTASQLAAVTERTGQDVERVIEVATQFDVMEPFAGQAKALVEAAGLSQEEWQVLPLLVNLPSLSPIAAAVLAILHGIAGHFPATLRLRPVPGAIPAAFEIAEILDLQGMRNGARADRSG